MKSLSCYIRRYYSIELLQDEGLDYIAEGLDTLKDMARAMDEVWLQVPVQFKAVECFHVIISCSTVEMCRRWTSKWDYWMK